MQLPQARAGAILNVNRYRGKFHGLMRPATPTGIRQVYSRELKASKKLDLSEGRETIASIAADSDVVVATTHAQTPSRSFALLSHLSTDAQLAGLTSKSLHNPASPQASA